MIDFTEEQIQRYSRHILLQDVGVEGQEKIMNARVLVVGAGGLGAPVSLYLAAAGIGTIGIVDADVVDLSNLQRQVIHFTKDVGVPKVWYRQLPREVPHQRCVYDGGQTLLTWWHPALQRTDVHPSTWYGLLSLYVQGTTSSWSRSHLFAGRSIRCYRWYAGHYPGCRDIEILYGYRRVVDQPSTHLRCQDHAVPYGAREASRLMRHLRHEPHHRSSDRLRTGRVRLKTLTIDH